MNHYEDKFQYSQPRRRLEDELLLRRCAFFAGNHRKSEEIWHLHVFVSGRKSVITTWPREVISLFREWAVTVAAVGINDGNKLSSPPRNKPWVNLGCKQKSSLACSIPTGDTSSICRAGEWYPADSSVFLELFQWSVAASDMIIYSLIHM